MLSVLIVIVDTHSSPAADLIKAHRAGMTAGEPLQDREYGDIMLLRECGHREYS